MSPLKNNIVETTKEINRAYYIILFRTEIAGLLLSANPVITRPVYVLFSL